MQIKKILWEINFFFTPSFYNNIRMAGSNEKRKENNVKPTASGTSCQTLF